MCFTAVLLYTAFNTKKFQFVNAGAPRCMETVPLSVISPYLLSWNYLGGSNVYDFGVLRKHVSGSDTRKLEQTQKSDNCIWCTKISIASYAQLFLLGFTVQFIVIMVRNKSSVEFILTVIVLPLQSFAYIL